MRFHAKHDGATDVKASGVAAQSRAKDRQQPSVAIRLRFAAFFIFAEEVIEGQILQPRYLAAIAGVISFSVIDCSLEQITWQRVWFPSPSKYPKQICGQQGQCRGSFVACTISGNLLLTFGDTGWTVIGNKPKLVLLW
jgi:hypothetical protein